MAKETQEFNHMVNGKSIEIPNIENKYKEVLTNLKKELKEEENFEKLIAPRKDKTIPSTRLASKDFKREVAPESLTRKYLYLMLSKIGINTHDLDDERKVSGKDLEGKAIHNQVDLVIPRGEGAIKELFIEIEPIGKNLYEKGSGLWQVEKWFEIDHTLIEDHYGLATNLVDWFFYDPKLKRVYKEEPEKALRNIADIYFGEKVVIRAQEKVDEFYQEFEKNLSTIKDSIGTKSPKILGLPEEISIEEKKELAVTFHRTMFSRFLFLRILVDWRLLSLDMDSIFKIDKSLFQTAFEQLFFKVLNHPTPRPPDILELFEKLPYLNGALFRKTEIELKLKTSNIRLIPEGYIIIWNMLSKYRFFVSNDGDSKKSYNVIDPQVLGYIFEKTVPARKETGSYYTRDEITSYIAHETINNYLLDRINKHSGKYPGYREFHTLDFRYMEDEICDFKDKKINVKHELAKDMLQELEEIKICDNAVGSGAFLIAIGEELIRIYKTMYKILGYKLPHYSEPETENIPLNYSSLYEIKKHILQNNLFGVDIQKEAVELCELRLWLWLVRPPEQYKIASRTLEPLPNIDYNIREGNSLIGYKDLSVIEKSKIKERKKGGVVRKFIAIESFFEDKVKKFQELITEYYDKKITKLEDIKKLNEEKNSIYKQLNGELANDLSKVISSTDDLEKIKPFHWIVDFYPITKRGGFDIIIGNPPYVRGENVKHLFNEYQIDFKGVLNKLYSNYKFPSTSDLAIYFMARSIELTKKEGYHSYIITDKWLKTGYGQPIRQILSKTTSMIKVIHLPNVEDAFVGIIVVTMIYCLKNSKTKKKHKLFFSRPSDLDNLEEEGYTISQKFLSGDTWNFLTPINQDIIKTIRKVGKPVKKIQRGLYKVLRGITSGYNKAFVITDELKEEFIKANPQAADKLKPVIGGIEIDRYCNHWKNKWIIFFPAGFTNKKRGKTDAEEWIKSNYSAIYHHLISFKDIERKGKHKSKGFMERDDQGDYWWELRSCSFYDEFEKNNIIWQEISREGRFSWEKKYYLLNSAYVMGNSEKYLLLFLNSELNDYQFSFISPKLVNPRRRFAKQYIERIYIRIPSSEIRTTLENIVDYLLFSKRNSLILEYRKLVGLANSIVYDIYFHEKFYEDKVYEKDSLRLIDLIKPHLKEIDYDKWADLKSEEIDGKLEDLKEKELEKLSIECEKEIKLILDNIFNSETIVSTLTQIQKYKWIQEIQNNPWIKNINVKTED